MIYTNTTILIVAAALLLTAYCIKHFKTLRDITKTESIKAFFYDTLNSLGLALIVGVVSIQLFQIRLTNSLNRNSNSELITYSEVEKDALARIAGPFRWVDPKIEAYITKHSDNLAHYKYNLSYGVKNYSDKAANYNIRHKITSTIGMNPLAKISGLKIYRVDQLGVRKPDAQFTNMDSLIYNEGLKGIWQAKTNIPEILLLPGEEIFVSLNFEYLDFLDHGYQIFSATHICNSFEFEITYDPEVFDISIIPLVNRGENDEFIEFSEDPSLSDSDFKTQKCLITSGLFYYQTVVMSYRELSKSKVVSEQMKKI